MAGITRDAGYADLSSTSSSQFIPEIWAGKLVEKFYDATVFGEIANTDYEGEIKNMGDNVVIRTTPTLTIRDYQIGAALNYENPTSPKVDLPINKGKYFAFEVDDVDRIQADIDLMDDWSGDGGEQMKIAVDTDLLASLSADIAATSKGLTAGRISGDINLGTTGTPILVDKTNVLDYILDLANVLDEENVPEQGRWLVVPAWFCRLIKGSDLKDASLAGDGTSILRNGRVGMIDRFLLYQSNNINSQTDGAYTTYNVIAGHKAGLTFAAQMTKMETLPNPNSFGQLIRGLNVYGRKVIEGKYLAELYCAKG